MASSINSERRKNTSDGNFKLIILHNNDMHARFEQTGSLSNKCSNKEVDSNKCYGGFARVAHEVRRFRKDAADGKIASVLYLNAGDTYTGTPWFTIYKDVIAAEFMEILKPDVMVSLKMVKASMNLTLKSSISVTWQSRV